MKFNRISYDYIDRFQHEPFAVLSVIQVAKRSMIGSTHSFLNLKKKADNNRPPMANRYLRKRNKFTGRPHNTSHGVVSVIKRSPNTCNAIDIIFCMIGSIKLFQQQKKTNNNIQISIDINYIYSDLELDHIK
ncbi:hypothetical protein DERP_003415 [Dermatophagoides pteronyssinus]|uniref:Uncharacterized protein n=1 Tax=Dermatophagoides pteronyssinus TaxID=6956 RepID=A0ABQ8JJF4_DERPT|nr:hypothetical protein DERP_003415 [Dermatophagoides pteronyssinus]